MPPPLDEVRIGPDWKPDVPEGSLNVQPTFEKEAQRTYEPRITFQIQSLPPEMMRQIRTVLFVLRLLESRVAAAGSIRKAAKALGVSRSFLQDVLRGMKPPGYLLSKTVGYVPKVFYLPLKNDGKGNPLPAKATGPHAGVRSLKDLAKLRTDNRRTKLERLRYRLLRGVREAGIPKRSKREAMKLVRQYLGLDDE